MDLKETKHLSPSERAAHEKQFFDTEWKKHAMVDFNVNPKMFALYTKPADLSDWRQRTALLMGDLAGRRILDYGCGIGEEATYFALLGAEVWAIDASETAITLAANRARHNGMGERVHCSLSKSTHLEFADNYFDLVHGLGVLHHVTLDALPEVYRVLKPGGRAVFLEHMGSSRHIVPALQRILGSTSKEVASEDEQPLDYRDVHAAGKIFTKCKVYPYHLLYRLHSLLPTSLHVLLRKFDCLLLRLCPLLKRYSGGAVIFLIK